MYGTLKIQYGDGRRESINIQSLPFRIGRHRMNHLVIREPSISRFHMAIIEENGQIVLKDLSSKSGTWVNGIRIQEHVLKDGDLIEFWPGLPIQIYYASTQAGADTTKTLRVVEDSFRALRWLTRHIQSLQSLTVDKEICCHLIEASLELVDADCGIVFTQNVDGEWKPLAALEKNKGLLKDPEGVEYSHTFVQKTIEQRKPEIGQWHATGEATTDSPTKSIISLRIFNILTIPLIARALEGDEDENEDEAQRLIGVLYLDRRRAGHPFHKNDIQVLETLAGEASRSLLFAQLYQRAAERERLKREMEWCRQVQQKLVPFEHLSTGFSYIVGLTQSAREVGGDFYAYFPVFSDKIAFYIGDVSGKGLQAALLMALCHGSLYTLSNLHIDFEGIVPTVHSLLKRYTSPSRYSTLFYGWLAKDGTLQYVNAGHPPALHIRKCEIIQTLEPHAPVIGLIESQYDVHTLTLQPWDMIVLFSDGVYERNLQNEMWGLEKWFSWLENKLHIWKPQSGRDLYFMLKPEIEKWIEEETILDDVTLLFLEYSGQRND